MLALELSGHNYMFGVRQPRCIEGVQSEPSPCAHCAGSLTVRGDLARTVLCAQSGRVPMEARADESACRH